MNSIRPLVAVYVTLRHKRFTCPSERKAHRLSARSPSSAAIAVDTRWCTNRRCDLRNDQSVGRLSDDASMGSHPMYVAPISSDGTYTVSGQGCCLEDRSTHGRALPSGPLPFPCDRHRAAPGRLCEFELSRRIEGSIPVHRVSGYVARACWRANRYRRRRCRYGCRTARVVERRSAADRAPPTARARCPG